MIWRRNKNVCTWGVRVADNKSRTACVSLSSSPCTEAPAEDPSPSDQAPDEAFPLPPPRPFTSLRGDNEGVLAPEFTSAFNEKQQSQKNKRMKIKKI